MPIAERRQIENEMIFRRGNEKVGIGLDKIDSMYVADGDMNAVRHDDMLIDFVCECSDENCTARIPVLLSVYQKIHLSRDSFIIKDKHQISSIEEITGSEPTFNIVKKHNSTTDPGAELNATSLADS